MRSRRAGLQRASRSLSATLASTAPDRLALGGASGESSWQAPIPGRESAAGPCSRVGYDVLNNDDDLPVRTLRDRVPDGQAVRRKVQTVGTRQRVYSRTAGY